MKLIKLLFVVIVALVPANVTLTNRSVDQSLLVSQLSADIADLQGRNTVAKARIAGLSSLSTLRPLLVEAGFVESPRIVAIPAPAWVASR